jgi:hypothetical protein
LKGHSLKKVTKTILIRNGHPTSLSLLYFLLSVGEALTLLEKGWFGMGPNLTKRCLLYGFFQLSLLQHILYLGKLGKFAV